MRSALGASGRHFLASAARRRCACQRPCATQTWQPGRTYVLAAPPKLGKTTVANAVAGRGVPALYLSFEMAPADLAEAHVCRLGRVSVTRTRAGMLGAEELGRWVQGAAALRALGPLYYHQGTTRTTLDAVATAAGALRERHGARCPLLVVDYLQKWALAGGGIAATVRIIHLAGLQ